MTYRDDLDAAQARIRQLEEELGEARGTIEALKRQAADKKVRREHAERPVRRLGRVTFKPPPSYFPLFGLLTRAAAVAFRLSPRARPLTSRVFVVWLAYKALYLPLLTAVWRPLYFVFLVFPVLPVAAILTVVASLVLVPFIFISRFQLGDVSDPEPEPAWLQGKFSDGQAGMALWILLSFCMQPLLFFYTSLLGAGAWDD